MIRVKYTAAAGHMYGRCGVFVLRVFNMLVNEKVKKYLAAFHLCSFRGI